MRSKAAVSIAYVISGYLLQVTGYNADLTQQSDATQFWLRFWEIGLQPWDMAAGNLLINEAGGKVTDFWGNPDHLNNLYIAAGNKNIHSLLIDILKKHFPKKPNG